MECLPFRNQYWCGLTYQYDSSEWGYCDEALCPPTKGNKNGSLRDFSIIFSASYGGTIWSIDYNNRWSWNNHIHFRWSFLPNMSLSILLITNMWSGGWTRLKVDTRMTLTKPTQQQCQSFGRLAQHLSTSTWMGNILNVMLIFSSPWTRAFPLRSQQPLVQVINYNICLATIYTVWREVFGH